LSRVIGRSGQEGKQAVLANDFSFRHFCYLEKRLLLIHGRLSYRATQKSGTRKKIDCLHYHPTKRARRHVHPPNPDEQD